MQIHQLTKTASAKTKKRVGRGGKRGTYSGHGGKGQSARAGRNFQPIIREVLKRYPKLRGYKNNPAVKPATVNVKTLEALFSDGDAVNPRVLARKGIVSRVSGKCPQVKILGVGDITKKIVVCECEISASAKEKIEKAGGTVKS